MSRRPAHYIYREHGEKIRQALGGSGSGGDRWLVRCPSHPDHTPSLSIRIGEKSLLVNCFAGCSREDVIAALRERGLWPTSTSTSTSASASRGRRQRRPRSRSCQDLISAAGSTWADQTAAATRLSDRMCGLIENAVQQYEPTTAEQQQQRQVNAAARRAADGMRIICELVREQQRQPGQCGQRQQGVAA